MQRDRAAALTRDQRRLAALRASRSRVAAWLARAPYLEKWLILGVAIGAIAGLGAVVFFEALVVANHLLLQDLGGYRVPTPRGEGGLTGSPGFVRPWAVPLVVGGGALVGAVLVHRLAPDAGGHGTDAAIAAVHDEPRGIRFRTVVVKIVASALTIGSGGSGGREGPTGQISAGFGSLLARVLDLNPSDARTAVATGIGSGIGSIFGAPLGGAVLATEILYRDDADMSILLPGFIASVTGFVIFGSVEGFGPIFGFASRYRFDRPVQLLWFLVLGLLGGLVGLAYAKGFYGIEAASVRLRVPGWVRPALGGLLVGALALAVPQVLGTGYGWIQRALGPGILGIPLWVVLLVPLARIVATGLSIGSGGSGGIFGPGLVIGAFVGAALWRLVEPLGWGIGHNPAPFVIVGMMSCFGSIARAPLAVMLMVAEMTGSLTILVPAMLAVGLATLIVRRAGDSIYRSQLPRLTDAPSRRLLVGLPMLAALPVARARVEPRLLLRSGESVGQARRRLAERGLSGAPVIDDSGLYLGSVSSVPAGGTGAGLGSSPRASPDAPGPDDEDQEPLQTSSLLDGEAPTVTEGEHLDVALELLTSRHLSWLPVVDQQRRVTGTVSVSDLVRAYREELTTNLRLLRTGLDESTSLDLEIRADSPLDGLSLAEVALPAGVLVTAVQRGRDLIVPDGATVLHSGDRLTLLGPPGALRRVLRWATGAINDEAPMRARGADGPADQRSPRAGA